MKKYVDIEEFYKAQIKTFKCVPLVGSSDNDCVSLKEIIEDTPGIYMADDIHENFTREKFLELLYSYWSVNSSDDDVSRCAKHLETLFRTSISNVLHCQIGDVLYFPINNKIEKYIVKEIKINDDGVRYTGYNELRDVTMTLHESYVGKTIFTNYKDAANHLQSMVTCQKCGFARERTDGSYHCCKDNTIRKATYSCGEGRKA